MKQTENDDYNNKDGSRWGSAVFNAPVTFQGPMFHIHDNDTWRSTSTTTTP